MTTGAPTVAALAAVAGLDATGADGVPGDDPEFRYDPQRTVGLLAGVLARLHLVPVPADAAPVLAPEDLVARAGAAVAQGWEPDPDGPYGHMAAGRLVDVLQSGIRGVAPAAGPVLTHGRPTLANLRGHRGAIVGLVDWEDAGVSDPYRDLSVAAQDVAGTLGPMLVPELFERYAELRPTFGPADPARVDWYVLAAQFPS